VLDKENATARKGIFMIDASKGFKKDGPKNRLREQDIHKIVDTFTRQDESDPRYARMVPVAEIADPKNDYNLNLPRYIDSTEPEDLQDIDGHLRGGIPERDLDALGHYWKIMPGLRAALFAKFNRPGYAALKLPIAEVKPAIFAHPEFTAFTTKARNLIETIAEDLLATFKTAPLLDAYDVYQHLMDYWAETMQDDCYLIADAGWKAGAQPREIRQVKNKEGKLVWPEKEDFKKGKRRFKSDLVPAALLIARYFAAERDAIAALEAELAGIEQQLDEKREEQSGEEGLLAEVIEGEGEKQKITAKAVKARLQEIGRDSDYAEERQALEDYSALLDQQADAMALKTVSLEMDCTTSTIAEKLRLGMVATEALLQELYREKLIEKVSEHDDKLLEKYLGGQELTEDEIKTLVVDDKWLATIAAAVQGELDRVSQTLTSRIRQLAERYATPLPQLTDEVATLAARVDGHLKKMGAVWK